MENGVCIKFTVGGFYMEFIVAVSEFKYLFFEIWARCERWFTYSGAPMMHNILSLNRVEHLHLGR